MLGYWYWLYTNSTSIKHIGLRLIPCTLNYLVSQAILFDFEITRPMQWMLVFIIRNESMHTKIRCSPKTRIHSGWFRCAEIHVKYGIVNYTLIMVLQVLQTDQGLFMTMFLNIQCVEIRKWRFYEHPESTQ